MSLPVHEFPTIWETEQARYVVCSMHSWDHEGLKPLDLIVRCGADEHPAVRAALEGMEFPDAHVRIIGTSGPVTDNRTPQALLVQFTKQESRDLFLERLGPAHTVELRVT